MLTALGDRLALASLKSCWLTLLLLRGLDGSAWSRILFARAVAFVKALALLKGDFGSDAAASALFCFFFQILTLCYSEFVGSILLLQFLLFQGSW